MPHHVWARGHDRRQIFYSDADRLRFLQYLGEARARRHCEIHAFVLMSNHIHLLVTPHVAGGLSKLMQDIGRKYVPFINRNHDHTGGLYEGRFKSNLVQTERYFFNCMRYIELNPVRAGMVLHPAAYRWSSYGQNITGEPTGLVSAHPEYLALAPEPQSRGEAYCRLLDETMSQDDIDEVRQSMRQERPLGSEEFRRAIDMFLGRAPDPRADAARARPP